MSVPKIGECIRAGSAWWIIYVTRPWIPWSKTMHFSLEMVTFGPILADTFQYFAPGSTPPYSLTTLSNNIGRYQGTKQVNDGNRRKNGSG